ncbi:helix-turn-helix transcriptional regulator [Streptomyces sp. A012304]|uniref:helix-turn-helix domain-containing protein n=1 Tax=Streptomyces sp. A012304 TaxID=375446 RepID=UPI0022319424|nr:helix-turn-helix transcriptional regulator [Streptomyces sp. A012304]
MSATEFALMLRELKERSGLSYGALAKRLHMSTSTLHRYCNGDAVPTDYAPVERLARLCKATPGELVELHRRWVLADAGRGRKAAETAAVEEAAVGPAVVEEAAAVEQAAEVEQAEDAGGAEGGGRDEGAVAQEVLDVGPPRRRRRPLLLAGIAGATALGAVALALSLSPSGGSGDDGSRTVGTSSVRGKPGVSQKASPSASVSSSPSPSGSSASPSASSPSPAAEGRPPADPAPAHQNAAAPLTVSVRPYAWESPCDQRYLVDREPGQVSPPPVERGAPAWVARHGAVSSGKQLVEVTVQGTGDETVVVDDLAVRTVAKRTPLPWNDFAMAYPGVGCGAGLPKRFFTVALDAARPALLPEAGHGDFPFSVSESDPEIYYISADASAYDVSWELELSWSSGSRHGKLTVDDDGRPFRVSGNNGRPDYEFPLGGSAWRRAGASSAP